MDFSTEAAAKTDNVDMAEIAKFEATARYWWDLNGALKALHDINPLRVGYINQRAGGVEGKTVIDVGCGGGLLSEAMARLGAWVTGIDMGKAPLAVAQDHCYKSGLDISYISSTAEEFAKSHPGRFDLVACLELLEHVPRPDSVTSACSRLVRPGGDVFFATINRNPKAYLFAIAAAEWIMGFVPRGTHSYRKFIKPFELMDWAQKSGLDCLDLTGLHYNPFFRRYSLGGNHHVNYLIHFRKPEMGFNLPKLDIATKQKPPPPHCSSHPQSDCLRSLWPPGSIQ